MNEIDIKDGLNEININDEIKERTERFGKALSESIKPLLDALDSLLDVIDGLEPYQRYELLHPRKKPRGSIRRKRKRRIVYAKDCVEIGKALYEGMMDGFGQGESEVNTDEEN